ncbi:MAG: hypothetical protein JXA54_16695 [Candidatus Heimdallarchaeota archaeon]|nr:hypothetical protein [Candidatus Heimdallarchaeota archaeon]
MSEKAFGDKIYCSRCGVEVEDDKTHCPLCQTTIQDIDTKSLESKRKYPDEQVIPTKKVLTNKQKRFLAWEITSVSLLIPLFITLFVDVIVSKTVSWSLYPIASLLFAWILLTLPLLFPNKIAVLIVGETLPLFVYLLVIDLIADGQIDWYLRMGLPIIAIIIVVSVAVALGGLYVKNKGANIAALILFGAGVICLGIDLTITSYLYGTFSATWSLYVLTTTVILGGFLLYIHFRIIRGSKIKRKLQM